MWIVVIEGAEPGALDALVRRHRGRRLLLLRTGTGLAMLVRARAMPEVPRSRGLRSFVGRVVADYEIAGDGAVAGWCGKATPTSEHSMIG